MHFFKGLYFFFYLSGSNNNNCSYLLLHVLAWQAKKEKKEERFKKVCGHRTIWNICILDFTVASLWITGILKKNLKLMVGEMCAMCQTIEYSNEVKLHENSTPDCQRAFLFRPVA